MKKIVFIAFLALIGAGCNFNELETDNLAIENYQGTIGIPIGEFNETFRRLFEDLTDTTQNIEIGSDSIFVMVFRDTIAYSNVDDLVAIDDIANGTVVSLPETPSSPVATAIPIDETFTFSYQPRNGEPTDSLVYNSGELSLRINSSLESDVDFRFDVLNTVDLTSRNNVVFDGNVASNSSFDGTQDLSNHATFLTLNSDQNTFQVRFTGTINLQAGDEISSTDLLSFNLNYRDQTFQSVFGFFGSDSLQIGNQSIDVTFFEDFGSGVVFENPQLNMRFQNSFGLPIGLLLGGISGVENSGASPNITQLSGTVTQSPQVVASPDRTQVGQSVEDSISVNAQNSNLSELLASAPDQLNFNLTAITNPGSTTADNFLTNESALETVVEMRLPLSVQFNNVRREIDFNLATDLNLSDVDSATIRFVTQNQLPLNARLGIQFKAEDSTVLATVDSTLVLASPFVNREGRVVEGEVNIANLPLDKEALQAFQDSAILTIILTLNTPETLNSQEIFVDILAQYMLEMKVSMIVKLNVDL